MHPGLLLLRNHPTVPAAAASAARDRDQDCYQTATPIVGRRRRSRDWSFSSRQGTVKVKPDNEMEIDVKGQGGVKDAASSDSGTSDTSYSDIASADTATDDTVWRLRCWWRNATIPE